MSDRKQILIRAGWECVNHEGPTLLWAHPKHQMPLRTTRQAVEHQKLAETKEGCRCVNRSGYKKDGEE